MQETGPSVHCQEWRSTHGSLNGRLTSEMDKERVGSQKTWVPFIDLPDLQEDNSPVTVLEIGVIELGNLVVLCVLNDTFSDRQELV
jgi:hypothetical protein